MTLTPNEKRDVSMVCNAYYDLFQNGKKPKAFKVELWVREYRIREKLDVK